MMSEQRGRKALNILYCMRQLFRTGQCAVRDWTVRTVGKSPLIMKMARNAWIKRSGKASAIRERLRQWSELTHPLMFNAASDAGQWGREASGWMIKDLCRIGRSLRGLPTFIRKLPSSIKGLPFVLIDFYTEGRPESGDFAKAWLMGQTGAARMLLYGITDRARSWIVDACNWMRQDAGAAKYQVSAMLATVDDWRTGKLQLDWRYLATKPAVVAALAGFILISGNLLLTQNRLVYAVAYNGREIGIVASRQAGEEIRIQVRQQLERQLGTGIFLPATLTYRTYTASRALLSSSNELSQQFKILPWMTNGEIIIVNHKPVLAVANKNVAQQLLDQFKAYYVQKYPGEQIQEVRFSDDVALMQQQVPINQVVPVVNAMALLQQAQNQTADYVVKGGDSLWSIARKNNLLVSDLLDANPQISRSSIHSGEKLHLNTSRPLVGVLVISSQVNNEPIPREVQVQADNNLWRGQTRVLQPGADGLAEVRYQIVRLNGQALKRVVLTSKVLKQPQPRLVAEGMQRTVAYVGGASRGSGSGVLSWPVSGTITSPFGYRGREFHTGIDIATSRGTPVRAAATGRVTFAGWDGGYGNCVIVDHGDGLATRYGHLSRIDVRKGELVGKGEVIGNVGATGRATGPHLHFEVISNGSVTSPLRFLR